MPKLLSKKRHCISLLFNVCKVHSSFGSFFLVKLMSFFSWTYNSFQILVRFLTELILPAILQAFFKKEGVNLKSKQKVEITKWNFHFLKCIIAHPECEWHYKYSSRYRYIILIHFNLNNFHALKSYEKPLK